MPSQSEEDRATAPLRWIDSDAFDKLSVLLFFFWCVLLLPFLFFAFLVGMAFDGGPTAEAYVAVISVWSYPITVAVAHFAKRRVPSAVFLPFINLLGVCVSTLLHRS